jgi:hypothetical protein
LYPEDADLYVACYDPEPEGKIQSIVVKGKSYRKIIHPLVCSYESSQVKVSDSIKKEDVRAKTTTESKATSVNEPQAQADEAIESQTNEAIESLDQSESSKDNIKIQIVEEDLVGEAKENQEEVEKKEKLAKELMDQMDSLYKQGLISKEIYEKEKLIILNITK